MKLKDILNHPLMAPIVDPVREVASFAWKGIATGYRSIAENFSDEMQASGNPSKAAGTIYTSIFKDEHFSDKYLHGYATAKIVTYGLTLLASGIAITFSGTSALAGKPFDLSLFSSGLTAAAAMPVVFPLLAGAVQLAFAIPAKGLPHMVHGLYKAIKFAANPKGYAAQQAAQQVVTQAQSNVANEDAKATIAHINAQLDGLSPEDREQALETLQKKFGGDFDRISSKTAKTIDAVAHGGIDQPLESAPIPAIQKKKFNPASKTS